VQELNQNKIKEIVDATDDHMFVGISSRPGVGAYVITGPQAGNLKGQKGWDKYLGYVAQIREKAGDFGSDLFLIRHPNGNLIQHANQCFWLMNDFWLKKAKAFFNVKPEDEDYSQPFTLGQGEYPEIGKIIGPKKDGPPVNNNPLMKITTVKSDGSKTVTIC